MISPSTSDLPESIERELHELARPMARLQCRLEIARLIGGPEAHSEAVTEALEDLHHLREAMGRLREVVAVAARAGKHA